MTAELAKELESEVLIESQDSIAKGMQHDALSLVTRYVGVGYDLIKGSPEGEFNGGGGDPGIKITRHIYDFTYDRNRKAFYMNQVMSLYPIRSTFLPLQIVQRPKNSRHTVGPRVTREISHTVSRQDVSSSPNKKLSYKEHGFCLST